MFYPKFIYKPLNFSTESENPPPSNNQQQSDQKFIAGRGFDRGNSHGGRRGGRGSGSRSSNRQSVETDPYDMTLAPLNIYENHSIPV